MSNKYIFLYASAMVIIVALILSAAATLLKPFQERNIKIQKKQDILSTINITADRNEAEKLFEQYIIDSKVINNAGMEIEGDAFAVDLQTENRKPAEDRSLPIFIAESEGQRYYIVQVRGAGLWGPLWGYLSFYSDMNTIAGANFDHAGETPGLGAEIADDVFQVQFRGKQIFDNAGNYTSVRVVRGGAEVDNPHEVDGITGGTITSNGVSEMLYYGLEIYKPYFLKRKTYEQQ